jgi:ABC-type branched-subunit amino acid transport system ATPase component
MLLEVDHLEAGYGKTIVLRDICLDVGEREIVAVVGHNGAGKSSLMSAIYGIIVPTKGRVLFEGVEITREKPSRKLARGIGYSPQGAPVFSSLTVADNLLLAGFPVTDQRTLARSIEHVQEIFPALHARRTTRAGSLSGGERQMLALGMLFVGAPRLVILDEPSGGLSPAMVDQMYASIRSIADTLNASVLIVEQNINQALAIADRVYVLANGEVRFSGSPCKLKDTELLRKLLVGF